MFAAAVFVALVYIRELHYEGRPLSEWLANLNEPQIGPEHDAATVAIKTIGTNALPVILKDLQAKDSWIELKFLDWFGKQRGFHTPTPAHSRQLRAVLACQVLGTDAKPALPELVRMMQSGSNAPVYPSTITRALLSVGDEAIPAMLQCLISTNSTCRLNIAFAFRDVSPRRSELVIPALIKALADPDSGVRLGAIVSLGQYRAKAAIPALKQTAERHPDHADVVRGMLYQIESSDDKQMK